MNTSELAVAEKAARAHGYVLARFLRRFSAYHMARLTKVFLEAFLETLLRSGKLTVGEVIGLAETPMDIVIARQQKFSVPSEISEEVSTNA